MGGTPNGLKQFFAQGRTTIKKHVFPNCLRSSSIMEGEMDFHAWVGSKIYSWMFFDIIRQHFSCNFDMIFYRCFVLY